MADLCQRVVPNPMFSLMEGIGAKTFRGCIVLIILDFFISTFLMSACGSECWVRGGWDVDVWVGNNEHYISTCMHHANRLNILINVYEHISKQGTSQMII